MLTRCLRRSEDQLLQAELGGSSNSPLYNPKALRTHILRLLGPKTILFKAFGLF